MKTFHWYTRSIAVVGATTLVTLPLFFRFAAWVEAPAFSDSIGSYPADRPVSLPGWVSTTQVWLGWLLFGEIMSAALLSAVAILLFSFAKQGEGLSPLKHPGNCSEQEQ